MIRSDKIKQIEVPSKDFDSLQPVLKVDQMSYDGRKHQLGFEVRRGEVVGFYGLVGSGRTEMMETVFGVRRSPDKSFWLDGETITGGDSVEMIGKGLILTPELRANGIYPLLSLTDNICSLFVKRFSSKAGMYHGREAKSFSNMVLDKNLVRYMNSDQTMSELSGGNMQKIIIGRSVEVQDLKVLILDEPTVGMDLGAKSEIYLKARYLADERNVGVVFVSSELDELLSVCDRLYVMYRGDVIRHFARNDFDKEQILSYAVKGAELDG